MNYYPNSFSNINGGGFNNPSPYPLGYGGYNGGYYGNKYTVFNPYEMQRRQQEAMQKQQDYIKSQQDIYANIYRASCKGREPNQDVIDAIYGKSQAHRIPGLDIAQQSRYESIVAQEANLAANNQYVDQFCRNMVYVNPTANQLANNLAKMHEQRKKEMPEDINMYEYFATVAQEDLRRAKENEVRQQQANLAALYNQNSYSQFLNKFTMNQVPGQISTDDMTISLPSLHSEEERRQRRLEFLKQIGLKS